MFKTFLHNYSVYVLIVLIIALTAAFEPYSSQWLRFDRSLIGQGQIWRLLSAHWVHVSLNHSILNALGVVLFAYFAGNSLNNLKGIVLVITTTGFVGLCLYWFSPHLHYYVGLSGAEHGFLLVALYCANNYSRRMAILIGAVIIAKVLWEQTPFYDDMAEFELIGARVAVDSHFFGVIAGLIFVVVLFCLTYFKIMGKED